jgi:hypothetical protein
MITSKELRAAFKNRTKSSLCVMPDGQECRVRLLSAALLKDAEVAAFCELSAEAKKRGFDVASFVDVDASTLDLERKIQLISRAFVQIDATGGEVPVFPVGTLREFDSVYLEAVFDLYIDHQDRSDCRETPMDEAAIDSIVAGVTSNASADHILGRLTARGLRRIVRALAAKVRDLGGDE